MKCLPVRQADTLWQKDTQHIWINCFVNIVVCMRVHYSSHAYQAFVLKDKLLQKKKEKSCDSGRKSCRCEGNNMLDVH